jgi:hypothetical protein
MAPRNLPLREARSGGVVTKPGTAAKAAIPATSVSSESDRETSRMSLPGCTAAIPAENKSSVEDFPS